MLFRSLLMSIPFHDVRSPPQCLVYYIHVCKSNTPDKRQLAYQSPTRGTALHGPLLTKAADTPLRIAEEKKKRGMRWPPSALYERAQTKMEKLSMLQQICGEVLPRYVCTINKPIRTSAHANSLVPKRTATRSSLLPTAPTAPTLANRVASRHVQPIEYRLRSNSAIASKTGGKNNCRSLSTRFELQYVKAHVISLSPDQENTVIRNKSKTTL